MSHEVDWNKYLYDEFVNNACLTDFERKVINYHVNYDMSITQIAMKMTSEDGTIVTEISVKRAMRSLKDKYDGVQKHSDILPPRKLKGVERKKKLSS